MEKDANSQVLHALDGPHTDIGQRDQAGEGSTVRPGIGRQIYGVMKCRILRAAEAFQSLCLIFLQLEKVRRAITHGPGRPALRSSVPLRVRLRVAVLLA